MKYPDTVKKKIAILDEYRVKDTLTRFNIFHLYPKGLAYPDGYYDSRFFECVGFNTKTMEKRNLGRHDAIDFWDKCGIAKAHVFADGAFLIKLDGFVETVGMTQELCVRPVD